LTEILREAVTSLSRIAAADAQPVPAQTPAARLPPPGSRLPEAIGQLPAVNAAPHVRGPSRARK
jgi:hypothetical protein